MVDSGEHVVVKMLLGGSPVVFDVGANIGEWTQTVLQISPDSIVHAFEPVPQTYHTLLQNLAPWIGEGRVWPNNCALADTQGLRIFHYYADRPSWSTFYRRPAVEAEYEIEAPNSHPVFSTTLDDYCGRLGIERIDFLKVDTEGAELAVLRGAERLLGAGQVDYVQFEYGGTYLDAGIRLEDVYQLLVAAGYAVFKIEPSGLERVHNYASDLEDFEYSNFLAAHERLQSSALAELLARR